MKVNWRGLWWEHLTVGPDKRFRFQRIQDALDSYNDSAYDNRYLIDVAPHTYREWVGVEKSFTAVRGQDRESVIIWRDNMDPGGRWPTVPAMGGGGSLIVAPENTTFVDDVIVTGLTAVRTNSSAPEAAIFVGQEETYPAAPAYDRIYLEDLHGIGSHDGIQVFGVNHDSLTFPRVDVFGCLIDTNHDALTTKGNMRFSSSYNLCRARSAGFPPFLTDENVEVWNGVGPGQPGIPVWKTTGYHHNVDRANAGATRTEPHPGCFVRSHMDVFQVLVQGNTGAQECAGILFYVPSGTDIMPHRFTEPRIIVIHDEDASPEGGPAGVLVNFSSAGGAISYGNCKVLDASISVRALNTGSSAPPSVSGARCLNNQGDGLAWLHVTGDVDASCASGPEYSVSAALDDARVRHRVYSEQPTRVDNAAQLIQIPEVA